MVQMCEAVKRVFVGKMRMKFCRRSLSDGYSRRTEMVKKETKTYRPPVNLFCISFCELHKYAVTDASQTMSARSKLGTYNIDLQRIWRC